VVHCQKIADEPGECVTKNLLRRVAAGCCRGVWECPFTPSPSSSPIMGEEIRLRRGSCKGAWQYALTKDRGQEVENES